ncbi:ABC transporter permease [Catellatospora sp. KI3]|uniref:ABC transporter permease n=1 Tax=Catellatospora sp. KI3 TaxID=3041620 RepID=UPI002482290C|nr:ABC transporter permease [Catellatospora sp. KI3]MDI1465099.1 ABC transporter permease [Catellatospora sp. KI3]
MAYDNDAAETTGQRRYRGEPGFHEEPEFRDGGGTGQHAVVSSRDSGFHHSRPAAAGNLDDVFDDPTHGAVGRDRLGVHFAWEGVLALGVVTIGYLLFRNHVDQLRGTSFRELLVFVSVLGLLALGASMTLRVGAVNLALGPVAAAAAVFYAQHGNDGIVPTAAVAVAFAAALGAVIALVVVGFHVPGWAGSLSAALLAVVWIQKQPTTPLTVAGEYTPVPHAYYLIGGFAALSLVGGLLGAIRSLRRGIGRFRPVGDPADRRGGLAGTVAALAIIGSTALAAVAGVLLAALYGAQEQVVVPTLGFDLTGLAVGAALVGGVSAFGRRGGVFGTLLATALLGLVMWYAVAADWKMSQYALAAGALAVGLVVTRLVETFGRPLPVDDPDDWSDVGVPATSSWSTGSGDTWANLPAQPAPPRTDQWGDDDRWSSLR